MKQQEEVKPYRVVISGTDNMHSHYDLREQASAACDRANAEAEKLDIKTRYEVKEVKEVKEAKK
jgi:hypothetical protein